MANNFEQYRSEITITPLAFLHSIHVCIADPSKPWHWNLIWFFLLISFSCMQNKAKIFVMVLHAPYPHQSDYVSMEIELHAIIFSSWWEKCRYATARQHTSRRRFWDRCTCDNFLLRSLHLWRLWTAFSKILFQAFFWRQLTSVTQTLAQLKVVPPLVFTIIKISLLSHYCVNG